MEFRSQFIGQVLLGCLWIVFLFAVAGVFFEQGESIAGWSREDVYVLIATWALIHELFNAFFWSGLSKLTEMVTHGTFDTILLRPVHPIWQLIFSRFELAPIFQVGIYAGVLIYFFLQSSIRPSFGGVLIFALLCLCGLLIEVAVMLGLVTLSFWFANIENLKYFYYSFTEMARYPTVVFKSVQVLFFTVLPAAYWGNVQALFLIGRGSVFMVIGTFGACLIFCFASWKFFTWGARRYSSASS